MSISVVLLLAIGWTAAASITAQNRADTIADQHRTIAKLEREGLRLGGELAATRAYYANSASEINRQYRELQHLASVRDELQSSLIETQRQLADAEAQYQGALSESSELNQHVAALTARLATRDYSNTMLRSKLAETGAALAGATQGRDLAEELRRQREGELADLNNSLLNSSQLNANARIKLASQKLEIAAIQEARALAQTEARRLNSRIAALNSDLDEAYHTNSSLRRRLAATSDALTQTHEHQIMAEQRGHDLAETVGFLKERLVEVRATQLELLSGIREKAQRNIASLSATLKQTGLPMAELLNTTRRRDAGVGGPLVVIDDDSDLDGTRSFEVMVSNLEQELLQWESMQTLMAHMPLARPTTSGYLSSHYGKRRDPIAGRRAFHKGVDIAAPTWTPIYATAPGVVTFAGTQSAYGRIVEIDHGHGFVTRYAHLKKILVKKGQSVTFHEEIAKMGTSGRSTGSHVHYEVLYEGKNVDPANFFKAGRYVFKVQDANR